LLLVRVVVKFDLPPADTPNDAPAVPAREFAQFLVRKRLKQPQFAWVSDEMFRLFCEPFRDYSRHRLQLMKAVFVHLRTGRSILGRSVGDAFFASSMSLGEGGGLDGRLSFSPSAFFAFSDGVGPRASGFFIVRHF
jgi:hypothetical protein